MIKWFDEQLQSVRSNHFMVAITFSCLATLIFTTPLAVAAVNASVSTADTVQVWADDGKSYIADKSDLMPSTSAPSPEAPTTSQADIVKPPTFVPTTTSAAPSATQATVPKATPTTQPTTAPTTQSTTTTTELNTTSTTTTTISATTTSALSNQDPLNPAAGG